MYFPKKDDPGKLVVFIFATKVLKYWRISVECESRDEFRACTIETERLSAEFIPQKCIHTPEIA